MKIKPRSLKKNNDLERLNNGIDFKENNWNEIMNEICKIIDSFYENINKDQMLKYFDKKKAKKVSVEFSILGNKDFSVELEYPLILLEASKNDLKSFYKEIFGIDVNLILINSGYTTSNYLLLSKNFIEELDQKKNFIDQYNFIQNLMSDQKGLIKKTE